MIKFLSYFNLFLGIILLALIKESGNSLDLLAILPILLFSWLTLFHLLKTNLKFANWHVYLGYFCIVLSALSMIDDTLRLLELFGKPIVLDFGLGFITFRTLFDVSVIVQVIAALRFNKHLVQPQKKL